ncbi:MAG: hypothetical protein WC859_08435 [Elusimicrobiota bacterium]
MIKEILFATLIGAAVSSSLYASAKPVGTINISVLDENGAVVQDAPVYIYGEHKTHFVGGKEIPGTTTLTMPAGHYRISTALVRKTGEYLDRFASHEAHVEVIPGDNVSIILTLKPVEDPLNHIDYAELSRIGVPSDIARNLN